MMTSPNRADAFIFYACTLISFLESRVDTYVESLYPFFQSDIETLSWLNDVWLPEEANHGRLMRDYVEATWPDFDWMHGYQEFSKRYVPQCAHEKMRPSASLETLARCVTETFATMIYRCVGSYTNDPELKNLMKRLSVDENIHRDSYVLEHTEALCCNNSFKDYGGKHLEGHKTIPRSFSNKIDYLEKLFALPLFKIFREEGTDILCKASELSLIRNSLVHGTIESLSPVNGAYKFTTSRPVKNGHELSEFYFVISEFPSHEKSFRGLATQAIRFSERFLDAFPIRQ